MSEFLHMGGYAFFVWSSFGATAAVFIWNARVAATAKQKTSARIRAAQDD